MTQLAQDVRFAVRTLIKTLGPGPLHIHSAVRNQWHGPRYAADRFRGIVFGGIGRDPLSRLSRRARSACCTAAL